VSVQFHEQLAVWREIRRIGADETQGLAAAGDVSHDDLLAWLRRIPSRLGPEAFLERCRNAGPQPGEAARYGIPPADPTFRDPETDELEALMAEIERVCPREDRPEGFGLRFPRGRAAALAALRRLPDRAGAEAVARALTEEAD
jgi:hypothetical protein